MNKYIPALHRLFFTLILFTGCMVSPGPSFPEQRNVDEAYTDECIAGIADGDVTVDGRPLLWKLRNENDIPNDVHYFRSNAAHYPGLGPATYSYLGVGPAGDSPEGPVRQGLNSQGLAVGWNVLNHSGWKELNHRALGFYTSIDQVRAEINALMDLSTYNYFIDRNGEAVLWESQTDPNMHWEYNTRAPARDDQWIDVDNADGDADYTTGVDVNLSGWVVRANAPGHFTMDGSDNLSFLDRYQVGRDVVGTLIFNSGQSTILSAKRLANRFFRDDALAIYSTVSNTIVQGTLPEEDQRFSTMWVLLGHSETGIFVPIWLLGVESGKPQRVPPYLDYGDDNISVYAPARGMYNAGFNQAEVQARTLPFEERLFDIVNDTLLPEWRSRDWTNPAAVKKTGEEMRRVQEVMDANAYRLLKYLYDHGAKSNYAPEISIDSVTYNNLDARFSVTALDADNDRLSIYCNYGDEKTGSSITHTYLPGGHFLVSCTATDEHGISQTDWMYITVEGTVSTNYLPFARN